MCFNISTTSYFPPYIYISSQRHCNDIYHTIYYNYTTPQNRNFILVNWVFVPILYSFSPFWLKLFLQVKIFKLDLYSLIGSSLEQVSAVHMRTIRFRIIRTHEGPCQTRCAGVTVVTRITWKKSKLVRTQQKWMTNIKCWLVELGTRMGKLIVRPIQELLSIFF